MEHIQLMSQMMGIRSNQNVTIAGGIYQVKTADDGMHADETLTISDGNIDITESYEGLEGLNIKVSGGTITLVSSDDGMMRQVVMIIVVLEVSRVKH